MLRPEVKEEGVMEGTRGCDTQSERPYDRHDEAGLGAFCGGVEEQSGKIWIHPYGMRSTAAGVANFLRVPTFCSPWQWTVRKSSGRVQRPLVWMECRK
jgi:hypothetical protein